MTEVAPDTWIVASTHPHKERMAVENLSRQGFHAYCPRIRKRVRHARRMQQVLRPLFPSYVFIRLNPHLEQWRSIASTLGVRSLIRFGEKPATLPDQFVAGLVGDRRWRGGHNSTCARQLPTRRESANAGRAVRRPYRHRAFGGGQRADRCVDGPVAAKRAGPRLNRRGRAGLTPSWSRNRPATCKFFH